MSSRKMTDIQSTPKRGENLFERIRYLGSRELFIRVGSLKANSQLHLSFIFFLKREKLLALLLGVEKLFFFFAKIYFITTEE